jgi:hypothetical protein
MLRELADIGMEIARALQGEVRARAEAVEDETAESPKIVAELGLAFSRVSRAVRQTLALEARLEDDRLARERAAEAAEEANARSNGELSERAARVKAKLMQLLHPDRERDHRWDDDWFEDLSDEADDEPGEGFVADRPAADVVAGVCGDLGLKRDLSLWADGNSAAVPAARGAGGAVPDRLGTTASADLTAPGGPGAGLAGANPSFPALHSLRPRLAPGRRPSPLPGPTIRAGGRRDLSPALAGPGGGEFGAHSRRGAWRIDQILLPGPFGAGFD